MKFDKETLIILGTCMVLILVWPSFSSCMGWDKRAEAEEKTEEAAPAESAKPAPSAEAKPAAPAPVAQAAKPAVPLPAATYPLGSDELAVTVSEAVGGVADLKFRKYLNNDRTADIEIRAVDPQGAMFAFFVPGVDLRPTDFTASGDASAVTLNRVLTFPGQGRVKLTQTIAIKENYTLRCHYTFAALDGPVTVPESVVSGGGMGTWHAISGDKIRNIAHRLDYFTTQGDFDDIRADKEDAKFFLNPAPSVKWAGVSNKYFCMLLKSDSDFVLWQGRWYPDNDAKQPVIATGAKLPTMTLVPGAPRTYEVAVYAGPKITGNLTAVAPDAGRVMHLAWGPLDYLARLLLWILTLFQHLCGSYGVSIILLTLLVRTVFYPLTAKGNESMKKMQKVQPKFQELREKYKDNPQLLNQKMAELYRQEGVNPFAGCLPILLQIPIFFALYAMLDNVIGLRHVSFLWCRNLAAADTVCRIPLFVDLPWIGNSIPVNPLALAMTALMVVQQRMTPMSMDPAQKKMMHMMPVIMLLFLYDLPSGLTLYWTVSNVFSIVQLWLQKRRGQTPKEARSN